MCTRIQNIIILFDEDWVESLLEKTRAVFTLKLLFDIFCWFVANEHSLADLQAATNSFLLCVNE